MSKRRRKTPRTERSVTLRDVACRAGVSIATASHALNGSRAVSRDSREQVLQAVQALGYRPNVLARGLKAGTAKLIGCLVSNLSNPLIAAAIEGAHAVLRNSGFGLLVYRTEPETDDVSVGVDFAGSYNAAGLLVIHPEAGKSPALHRWCKHSRPIVLAIHPSADLAADQVVMADEQAAYQATRYLIALGHRRIALLSRSLQFDVYAQVAAGYRYAIIDSGLQLNPNLIRAPERRLERGAEHDIGYYETLNVLKIVCPPTAIVCAHNQIAVGTLKALRDQGIVVPTDVSILTFDDMDWMQINSPSITSIAIPGETLGKKAAEALLKRLDGTADPPKTTSLELELTVRESSTQPLGGSKM